MPTRAPAIDLDALLRRLHLPTVRRPYPELGNGPNPTASAIALSSVVADARSRPRRGSKLGGCKEKLGRDWRDDQVAALRTRS